MMTSEESLHALLAESDDVRGRRVAAQERQCIRAVDVREHLRGAGPKALQLRAQLVGQGDAMTALAALRGELYALRRLSRLLTGGRLRRRARVDRLSPPRAAPLGDAHRAAGGDAGTVIDRRVPPG